jgi:hypothetical protein
MTTSFVTRHVWRHERRHVSSEIMTVRRARGPGWVEPSGDNHEQAEGVG